MEITREYWDKHIQSRFNEPPNLMLESELIEFASKALDIVESYEGLAEANKED